MADAAGKLENALLQIEGGAKLHCWFNPKEYTITKTSTFNAKAAAGKDFPTVQYGGGQPATLTVDLLFDAFKPEIPQGDVMGIAAELMKLLQVKPGSGGGKRARPPQVEFQWGGAWTFPSFVESLTIQYLRFAESGVPTRMLAKLKLKQAEKEKLPGSSAGGSNPRGQNPTTIGLAGLATHVVRDGDTLQSIAFAHYRDPTRWRTIAEANQIDDPMRLRRGASLTIPRDDA
jgi:nucleoid-associated protein YgaU